jgi:hypothetical protein
MEFHVESTGLDSSSRLGSSLFLMILVGSNMFPTTKRPSKVEEDFQGRKKKIHVIKSNNIQRKKKG